GSVCPICRAFGSWTAAAPTVAVSALDRASTLASTSTIRVRAGPPEAATTRRLAACPPRRTTRYADPSALEPAGVRSVLRNGPRFRARSLGFGGRRCPRCSRRVPVTLLAQVFCLCAAATNVAADGLPRRLGTGMRVYRRMRNNYLT